MNSVYNHGIKQTQSLTRDLAAFEKSVSTSPMSLQGLIITSLTGFKKTIKEYNDLVRQSDAVEEKHQSRLSKFQDDLANFQAKFDSLRQQREALVQAESHQQLTGRRNVAESANTASDNPYDPVQAPLSYLEGLYTEKQSLGRGNQQLDMILEMGQNALGDLVEQNETLRKLGAKFEESLLTLGVSQGTIRRVERRAKEDKWLFWGMLVIFFVLCYFIIRYFH